MTKIRLMLVIDNLASGGIQGQMTEVLKGLDRDKFELSVLCFYGEKIGRNLHYLDVLKSAGIPVHMCDLGYDPISKLRAAWAIVQHARRSKAQIIHPVMYHANILTGWVKPLLPRNCQIVTSVLAENTTKQQQNQHRIWQVADNIIVNSPHLQQELKDAGISASKIALIYNGPNVDRFQQQSDPAFRNEVAPGASSILLMPVRIVERKAPQLAVQALAHLQKQNTLAKDIRLIIVGEKEDSAVQEQLENCIAENGLQEIVIQHGATERVEEYYHAADFIVLPSLYGEGLPNVILEAFAVGRPLILSEAANRAEVVEHGITGWIFKNGDVSDFANQIQTALDTPPTKINEMRTVCRTESQKYTSAIMIDRHAELYQRLMNSS